MKGKSLLVWIFTIAITFALLSIFAILKGNEAKASNKIEFQRGMCYVTWNREGYSSVNSDESLKKMKEIGVDCVSIVTTWYQDAASSFDIRPEPQKTPSDEGLIRAIKKAHELGMKVMVKPQLDILGSEGAWRGDIQFGKDEQWEKWFDNYAAFILHYVDIAIANNVELFCIGTELTSTALDKPDLWKSKVIVPIRAKYKGLLTYAANWYKEYSQIQFWKDLDIAGIDAYFPIGDKEVENLETLRKNWKDWLMQIETWQKKIDMPVCFTEVGYKSCTGTFIYPWEYLFGRNVDMQQQLDGAKAVIDTFGDKPWFCGTYWWHWGTNVNMGGIGNRGFILNNKPATDLISDWYKGKYTPYKEAVVPEPAEAETK